MVGWTSSRADTPTHSGTGHWHVTENKRHVSSYSPRHISVCARYTVRRVSEFFETSTTILSLFKSLKCDEPKVNWVNPFLRNMT